MCTCSITAGNDGEQVVRAVGAEGRIEGNGTAHRHESGVPFSLSFPTRAPNYRSTNSLLLDHPDADFRLHVGVQADRDAVDAERLDRLVQIDLPLLDVEALRLELLRDVGRRDRTEQLALFADARREGERHLLELLGELLRRAATLVLGRLEAIALLLDALQVARRRLVGEAVRQEIVAGVARP